MAGSDCWNNGLLADLAEVIPGIAYLWQTVSTLLIPKIHVVHSFSNI